MPTRISSRKAKGRRLQKWTADWLTKITSIPNGKDLLIQSREMGQSGTDIKLIGIAALLCPLAIECKNQEKFCIPEWIKQAKENKPKNDDWLLVIKKNRWKTIIVMDYFVFFDKLDKFFEHSSQAIKVINKTDSKTLRVIQWISKERANNYDWVISAEVGEDSVVIFDAEWFFKLLKDSANNKNAWIKRLKRCKVCKRKKK